MSFINTQIILGIIVNTIFFGIMGVCNNKLGIPVPQFLKNKTLQLLGTIVYFVTFLVVLLAPGNILIKILICLLMQFLVNHIIWGAITGIIAGVIERRKRL